jgi:hypothetical protein
MKSKSRNIALRAMLVIIFFAIAVAFAEGQCPMCKIGAESNLRNGGTAGSGLNTGILYMLAMPYLLVATIGIVWYKNRRKEPSNPEQLN